MNKLLPIGFPLVPFLNGILYRLVYNRKKAYLFNNYLLFNFSIIIDKVTLLFRNVKTHFQQQSFEPQEFGSNWIGGQGTVP